MLLAERQNQIINELNQKGRVHANELSALLGVSEDTIRRDLNKLAELKLLRRVHGGALPLQLEVDDYAERLDANDPEKAKRAHKAIQFIEPGQTILLNSGETCRYIAKGLPKNMNLTVVSACPLIASDLAHHTNIDVILLGGTFFKPALRCVGATTVEALRRMRFDLCFLGLCALHPERGFSAKYLEEAEVIRISIEQSDRTIVMGSAERLGKVSYNKVADCQALDVLITDKNAEYDILNLFTQQGLEIISC